MSEIDLHHMRFALLCFRVPTVLRQMIFPAASLRMASSVSLDTIICASE